MDITITEGIVEVTVNDSTVEVELVETTEVVIEVLAGGVLYGASVGLSEAIEVCFDGQDDEIVADTWIDVLVADDMIITGWTILADQSGDIAIGVWKSSYASFPPSVADSILIPAISSAESGQATGFAVSIRAGEIIRLNVNSVATLEKVTLALTGVRS